MQLKHLKPNKRNGSNQDRPHESKAESGIKIVIVYMPKIYTYTEDSFVCFPFDLFYFSFIFSNLQSPRCAYRILNPLISFALGCFVLFTQN